MAIMAQKFIHCWTYTLNDVREHQSAYSFNGKEKIASNNDFRIRKPPVGIQPTVKRKAISNCLSSVSC